MALDKCPGHLWRAGAGLEAPVRQKFPIEYLYPDGQVGKFPEKLDSKKSARGVPHELKLSVFKPYTRVVGGQADSQTTQSVLYPPPEDENLDAYFQHTTTDIGKVDLIWRKVPAKPDHVSVLLTKRVDVDRLYIILTTTPEFGNVRVEKFKEEPWRHMNPYELHFSVMSLQRGGRVLDYTLGKKQTVRFW